MTSYLPLASKTGWILRRMGFDRNPLRRPIDRVHAIVRAMLAILFLVGGPGAAVTVSHEVESTGLQAGRAQAAAWHIVPAVVLRERLLTAAWRQPGTARPVVLSVRWMTPRGWSQTERILVGRPAVRGSKVPVWLNASGRPTQPPLTRSQISDRAVGAAVATLAALAILLWVTSKIALRTFDRYRLARWEADWLLVEPRWTKRQ